MKKYIIMLISIMMLLVGCSNNNSTDANVKPADFNDVFIYATDILTGAELKELVPRFAVSKEVGLYITKHTLFSDEDMNKVDKLTLGNQLLGIGAITDNIGLSENMPDITPDKYVTNYKDIEDPTSNFYMNDDYLYATSYLTNNEGVPVGLMAIDMTDVLHNAYSDEELEDYITSFKMEREKIINESYEETIIDTTSENQGD